MPTLFQALFDDTLEKHAVPPGQLTLHAGGPMKATALMLAGVTRSHSRPHTSNDNPFSEAHFKTLKYQPQFPRRFGCVEDAKDFLSPLLRLVQSGPPSCRSRPDDARSGPLRPGGRHPCRATADPRPRLRCQARALRQKAPVPPAKPTAVWINPP